MAGMPGAELDEYFAKLEAPSLTDEGDPLPLPPTPDLTDATDLDRYFLLEEFSAYPNVRVFKLDVEDWPRSRLRNFRAIRLAKSKAREDTQTLDQAWAAMQALPIPKEWQ